MRKSGLIGAAVAALSTVAVTGGVAIAQHGPATPSSDRVVVHFPAHGAGGVKSHTCFWGLAYTEETRNFDWPDSHTGYWYTSDLIPPGGKIVLHGRFPHSRFFSLTASSTIGVIRSYLYDDMIKPDPGSTNPYLPGADRDAKRRSYTVTIVDQGDPGVGHRQPNTVYAGVAGQAAGTGRLAVVERVYLPDRGRDWTGGVGVPSASYVVGDRASSTGAAACGALQTQSGAFSIPNVNKLLFPESSIKQLLALSKSPEHPAVDPAAWYRYFGPLWLLAPYYAGTSDQSMISTLPLNQTGLGANPANGFVFAWLDRSFGPNRHGHNIAILRGKLPTTPATYSGESRMQAGTQLRYWSLCNTEGLATGAAKGACLADEELPINSQRYYTIVISLPQDRPKNATDKCGVAWMDWGATGDGYTRPRSTFVYIRNLSTTAHPAFRSAAQNVASPSELKPVMGAYLPSVTYTTARQFDKQGCTG